MLIDGLDSPTSMPGPTVILAFGLFVEELYLTQGKRTFCPRRVSGDPYPDDFTRGASLLA